MAEKGVEEQVLAMERLLINLHSYLIFCNKKGGYGSFMSHCHQ